MQLEESLGLQLNNNPERINTYLPMTTTLARMSCVRVLSPKRWFPAKIKALCLELQSYQIEMPEGITYRQTQNHLRPFKPYQKTQNNKQYREQSTQSDSAKIQLTQSDSVNTSQHPKRNIKAPVKLNL